jgi:2-phosphoglycolate phosphatase
MNPALTQQRIIIPKALPPLRAPLRPGVETVPRALLFDIDGTLVDTFDAILSAMNVAMDEVGEDPLTPEELRPLIGRSIASQMALLRGMSGPLVDRIQETYYRHFVDLVKEGLRLYEGVESTLEALEGRAMGTITTRRRKVARLMLREAGIEEYFTAVVGGDEVSRPKPHPELVRHACRAIRVAPSEAVAVGDSPVDILAGRAAGTFTVAALYGYGDDRELMDAAPDQTINRFRELPEALDRLGPRSG